MFDGKIQQNNNVLDHLETKLNAIRLSTEVALTILSVDQIIMSKPSGGPQFKQRKVWDQD